MVLIGVMVLSHFIALLGVMVLACVMESSCVIVLVVFARVTRCKSRPDRPPAKNQGPEWPKTSAAFISLQFQIFARYTFVVSRNVHRAEQFS